MQEIFLVHLQREGRLITQDIAWASFKLHTSQNILASQYTHQLCIALSLKQLDPRLQPASSTCLEWSQAHFCWMEISFSDTKRTVPSESQRNLFLIKLFLKKVIEQSDFSMCPFVLVKKGSMVLFSCSSSSWNVPVNIQWISRGRNMRNTFLFLRK